MAQHQGRMKPTRQQGHRRRLRLHRLRCRPCSPRHRSRARCSWVLQQARAPADARGRRVRPQKAVKPASNARQTSARPTVGRRSGASAASPAVENAAAKPLPRVANTKPLCCSIERRTTESLISSAGAMSAGASSHPCVESSMSLNRNVTVPAGTCSRTTATLQGVGRPRSVSCTDCGGRPWIA